MNHLTGRASKLCREHQRTRAGNYVIEKRGFRLFLCCYTPVSKLKNIYDFEITPLRILFYDSIIRVD